MNLLQHRLDKNKNKNKNKITDSSSIISTSSMDTENINHHQQSHINHNQNQIVSKELNTDLLGNNDDNDTIMNDTTNIFGNDMNVDGIGLLPFGLNNNYKKSNGSTNFFDNYNKPKSPSPFADLRKK